MQIYGPVKLDHERLRRLDDLRFSSSDKASLRGVVALLDSLLRVGRKKGLCLTPLQIADGVDEVSEVASADARVAKIAG